MFHRYRQPGADGLREYFLRFYSQGLSLHFFADRHHGTKSEYSSQRRDGHFAATRELPDSCSVLAASYHLIGFESEQKRQLPL